MPELVFGLYALIDAGISAAGGLGAAAGIASGAVEGGEALSKIGSGGANSAGPQTQIQQPFGYLDPSQVNSIVGGIGGALPNIQSQTGGATSPNYDAFTEATQQGSPGQNGLALQAVQSWLGQAPGSPGLSGGGGISQSSTQQNPQAVTPEIMTKAVRSLMQSPQQLTLQPPF